MKAIFLDMDGVIADFMSAALGALGRSETPEQITTWRCYEQLATSEAEFWDAQKRDHDFWYNISPYPNIGLFIDCMRSYADVYFASSPSLHPNCASHKMAWLRNHVGAWTYDRVMLGKPKHLLSGPGRLLIDDFHTNVDNWVKEGGEAILFPRSWNPRGHMPETQAQIDVMNQVREWSYRQ
jgi:5'(3')-deoxyribonucleotidase